MQGYIDIHTHILPGFDDGSKSEEESLAIIEHMKGKGFSHVVCTPHLISGMYNHSMEKIEQGTRRLSDAVRARGLEVDLYWAAENYLDDAFFDLLETGKAITYGTGNKHILVEMPFLKIPDYLEELTFRMMLKRFKPIVAHPERYSDIVKRPKRIRDLVNVGYQVQINLGSLGDLYGRSVRRTAEKLLGMGVVDYVASDIHSAGHLEPVFEDGLNRLFKVAGQSEAVRILTENPARMLGLSTESEGSK